MQLLQRTRVLHAVSVRQAERCASCASADSVVFTISMHASTDCRSCANRSESFRLWEQCTATVSDAESSTNDCTSVSVGALRDCGNREACNTNSDASHIGVICEMSL